MDIDRTGVLEKLWREKRQGLLQIDWKSRLRDGLENLIRLTTFHPNLTVLACCRVIPARNVFATYLTWK